MRNRSAIQTRGGSERGYALLIVMFLLTLLVLMTITVAPNAITDAQREKETEMIWRGKQYVRGIKRYYMKTHRFPLEMDDLTKPKTGIRFMRQAYKDPMNPVDGAWRLIYVGPNGQLIGSLKPQTQNPGGLGTPVSSMASSSSGFGSSSFGGSSSSFGNSSFGGSSSGSGFGNSSFGGSSSSFGNSSFGNSSSSFGNSSFGNSSFGSGSSFNSSNGSNGFGNNTGSNFGQPNAIGDSPDSTGGVPGQEPTGALIETPVIMGGNIIGVGSKVNKKSYRWYEKAKNYRQFEFIWDPSKDTAAGLGNPGQQGPGLGTPIGGQNGLSPVSSGFGQNQTTSPTNPNQPASNPPEGGPPLQAPPPQN